ncbi:MAG: ABC transporter permease, partial [Asgard group archaeon]|nr:ABC transporter permease [Asgard group archaeon]
MFYAIKHAIRGLSRRKFKNFINMIGIVIGVSLLAGVQIATDSLVNAMKVTVSLRYGNADITIQNGEYVPEFFNYSVYETLVVDANLSNYIDGIAPRITSQVSITSVFTTKQTEPFVTVIGINETLDQPFGSLTPDETYGNNDFNFTNLGDRECIIGHLLAETVVDFDVEGEGRDEQLVLPLVSPIEMSFLDAQNNFRTLETLRVKGVAKAEGKGILNTGYVVFMKIEYLQDLFNTTGNDINNIVVSTTEENENAIYVKEL